MEKKKFDEGEKSSMTKVRKLTLESIGFEWAKPKGRVAWMKRYNELVAFNAKFGHCNFPTKSKDNPGMIRLKHFFVSSNFIRS